MIYLEPIKGLCSSRYAPIMMKNHGQKIIKPYKVEVDWHPRKNNKKTLQKIFQKISLHNHLPHKKEGV